MKKKSFNIILPKVKRTNCNNPKEASNDFQNKDLVTQKIQKYQHQTSEDSSSDNTLSRLDSYPLSAQKQKIIQNLKIKLSLNNHENNQTKPFKQTQIKPFILYKQIYQKSLKKTDLQNQQPKAAQKSKHQDFTQTQQKNFSKKRIRRNLNQVKDSYRCFCGKSFVSYTGIYTHLKEKHLQKKEKKKFFLKTFKHKVTGDKIRQVVLQDKSQPQAQSEAQENSQSIQNKRMSSKKNEPIVLEIIDDDNDNNDIKEKVISKNEQNKRKRNKYELKDKQEMKSHMQKYFKLTCQYKELLEKFLISQKEQTDKEKSLTQQLQKSKQQIRNLEVRNAYLESQAYKQRLSLKIVQNNQLINTQTQDKENSILKQYKYKYKENASLIINLEDQNSIKKQAFPNEILQQDYQDGQISLDKLKTHSSLIYPKQINSVNESISPSILKIEESKQA